ncbi:MAG TPA: phosphoadenosine phosphosulfate reductase family protein [Methanoregulaceae archaeon]|nr:phosphoadenosine phosphosulfate reductase family protein [Methanoregulaceae archaeon]
MRPLYLGRIQLRWCDACHVPVLDEVCGRCGGATRAVPVTPPGDARPAFSADVALVNRIYDDHFGAPLVPEGTLALMNKVPDPDRMEEVVVGGAVVGHIRYIPAEDRWEPIPRVEAGALLSPKRRFVVADEGAIPSIRDQGASLLAPGLREIDDEVRAGDEVFILAPDRTVIGVGRARVSAAEARAMGRGAIVRTRRNVSSPCVPGAATWADAVAANRPVLDRYEATSAAFVREVVASYPDLPVTVSYSGGKDSLATLLVVRAALGTVPPLLFADTGFEFPETYANIDEVAVKYGAEVVRSSGETAFDATFAEQGPPAVDARWCCGVCKLAPIGEAIRGRFGQCLSFIGQRKYESYKRAKSRRVWRNPALPAQLSAAPIHTWTALHVWLYLFREAAPYNPLYERGLDRIGCYICPSSDLALLRMIERDYPGPMGAWNERLGAWQREQGLPDEWVTEGHWRRAGTDGARRGH